MAGRDRVRRPLLRGRRRLRRVQPRPRVLRLPAVHLAGPGEPPCWDARAAGRGRKEGRRAGLRAAASPPDHPGLHRLRRDEADERCPEDCSERRIELVNGADYDKLAAAAAACRDRIRGLRAVAEELARAEPAHGEWKAAYEALQQSARSALRRFRPGPESRDDPFSPVPTVVVWRCPDCGGVDAPQPCIGVCIGARPCGLMRPVMNWSAPGLPPIARPSGPWPTCFAGSRRKAACRAMGAELARLSNAGAAHPAVGLTGACGSPVPSR